MDVRSDTCICEELQDKRNQTHLIDRRRSDSFILFRKNAPSFGTQRG